MNPFFATDGYKTGHHLMYPEGTTTVYSNFTPRDNKYAPQGINKVVSFGQQLTMMKIHNMFKFNFFDQPKVEVCAEIATELSMYLGGSYDVSHIEDLHDLSYLPIKVKALPEGTLVPMGVPLLTIVNTLPEFYWLTNFLETLISNLLWKPITSATLAHQYKKNLTRWARKTNPDAMAFVDFQGHDFSMRGQSGLDSVMASGLGHAASFLGSDSLPVIYAARHFYGEDGIVIMSVNATEHAVMSAGGKEDEQETFKRLMKIFPTGILSVVSDTWDLWKVLTEHLPALKEEILARDGKLVIRPDSGDPADIICGVASNPEVIQGFKDGDLIGIMDDPEHKGVIELLWDTFGGTINEKGYKVLDSHIGAIYGDSITLDRADDICRRLADKGFASTNVVLGIGSFTYQYNTRDTFGFAMKATFTEVEEPFLATPESTEWGMRTVGHEIFKDPVTGDGLKKSAKGLLVVHKNVPNIDEYNYYLEDQVSWEEEGKGCLQVIYEDGIRKNMTTLTKVRERLQTEVEKWEKRQMQSSS